MLYLRPPLAKVAYALRFVVLKCNSVFFCCSAEAIIGCCYSCQCSTASSILLLLKASQDLMFWQLQTTLNSAALSSFSYSTLIFCLIFLAGLVSDFPRKQAAINFSDRLLTKKRTE